MKLFNKVSHKITNRKFALKVVSSSNLAEIDLKSKTITAQLGNLPEILHEYYHLRQSNRFGHKFTRLNLLNVGYFEVRAEEFVFRVLQKLHLCQLLKEEKKFIEESWKSCSPSDEHFIAYHILKRRGIL